MEIEKDKKNVLRGVPSYTQISYPVGNLTKHIISVSAGLQINISNAE